MEIKSIRLFEGQQRMEVLVHAGTKLYRIPYRWFQRNATDTPPASWLNTVRAEVRLLQEKLNPSHEALNKIIGRPR
jgi:hypothetical protein